MLDTIDSVAEGQLTDNDSIDDVVLAIEHAAKVYEQVNRMVVSLEEAKALPIKSQRQILAISTPTLRGIYANYGMDEERWKPVYTLESSMSQENLIVALEEEEKDAKGFLTRIIDAITNAFKWLWEKITSLFSSGETEKSADQKGTEIYSDLERQIKSTPDLPAGATLSSGEINRYLSGLIGNKEAVLGPVAEFLKMSGSTADDLSKFILAISECLREAGTIGERVKSTPTLEVLNKEKEKFVADVKKAVIDNGKQHYTADAVKDFDNSKIGELVEADSRLIGLTLSKSGLLCCLLAAQASGSYKSIAMKQKKPAESSGKVAIKLPSKLAELLPIQEAVNNFAVAVGRMNDDLKSKASSLKADGNKVAESLQGLKGSIGKGDESAKAIKSFCDIAQGIGQIQGSVVTMIGAYRDAAAFANTIIPAAIEVAKKGESSNKKEEKPAEGSGNPDKPVEPTPNK